MLIDTSVWIDVLRGTPSRATAEVRRQMSDGLAHVVICEPIAMELLAGAGDESGWSRLEALVNGLPSLALDAATDFRSAARLFRAARTAGLIVRSLSDCLIAAMAIRHDVTLLHQDVDYEVLARLSTLNAISMR